MTQPYLLRICPKEQISQWYLAGSQSLKCGPGVCTKENSGHSERDIIEHELYACCMCGFKDGIVTYLLLLLFCFVGDTDRAHAKHRVVY